MSRVPGDPPPRLESLSSRALLAPAVFVFTLVLYWPCLQHPFNFDDEIFLRDENVRLGRWTEWLIPPPPRFLTWIGFLIQYQTFGPQAAGFHAVSVLLHALNSVVVFLILGVLLGFRPGGSRRASGRDPPVTPFAWAGALVFAFHPVQTESVLNVYQQSTLLGSLFVGLSLLCWIGGRLDRGWSAAQSLSLVFFLLALAAKETAAVLPLILWVFEGFFRDRWKVWSLLPFVAFSGLATVGYLAGSATAGSGAPAWRPESALGYAIAQVKVVWLYVLQVFGLHPLNVDHQISVPRSIGADPVWWLALAGWIALGWGLFRLKRHNAEATFCILVFFLFLMPTSTFLPRPDLAFEHRMYGGILGVAGLFAVIGRAAFAANAFSRPRRARVGTVFALVAAVAFCAWGSTRRIRVWSDPVTLWRDAVSKSPEKYRPNYNLGVLLMNSAPERAEFYLTRAIEIDPSIPPAFRSLGQVHFQQGRLEEAERFWRQALLLEPNDFDTHLALGRLQARRNDFRAASEQLRAALRIGPDRWEAHAELAQLELRFGFDRRAIQHAERALALNPSSSELHFLLGDAVSLQSNWKRAAELYEKGLEISPDDPSRWFSLARIYGESGQMEKARRTAQAGLSMATSPAQRQAGERVLRKLDE